MTGRLRASAFLAVLATTGWSAPPPAPPGKERFTVERAEGGKVVRVLGLDARNRDALRRADWDAEKWSALFAVYVDREGERPAVLGSYKVLGDALQFEPRFPFARGTRYRAVFDPSRLPHALEKPYAAVTARFEVPRRDAGPPTVVRQVYASHDRLPENHLKFYIHFSAPMSRGDAYDYLKLLDASGKEVFRPFLELEQELWNPDGTRFTLFFNPGRIKRGLKPREEYGPILEDGKKYTLVIDRAWRDGDDRPLGETFRKTFTAGPADDSQPDPKKWRLAPPAAGSTKPLAVRLDEPLDHALLQRMVWVADAKGRKVEGSVAVTNGETRWHFTPRAPWQAGAYRLVADTRLEDRAGNSIRQPFEVDVTRTTETETKVETVAIPFQVESAPRK